MIAASSQLTLAILSTLLVSTEQLPLAHTRTPYPEANLNTCDIIRFQGYSCQEHSMTTEDGYILTMQRLSSKESCGKSGTRRRGLPVVLQHGLLQSSIDWVINYPNQSLGFLLADAGYDVWLGNVRGNTYSKGHVSLNSHMKQYWRFTFDHMAAFDLPAMVEYVLRTTNYSSLHYVGHSQGTLIGFACFSEKPEWAQKKWALEFIGYDFMPNTEVTRWIHKNVCKGMSLSLCETIIHQVGGYDSRNINSTRLPVYLSHYPAGTSALNIAHFGQLITTDRMQKYDYGHNGNWDRYGQYTPPEYEPERSRVPTALYWGANDILTVEEDVKRLINRTKYELGLYRDTLFTALAVMAKGAVCRSFNG